MKNPKSFVDCCVVTITCYFAGAILGMGLQNLALLTLMLVGIYPVVCMACGVICGMKNGFSLYYPLFAAASFLLPMFIFFDMSMLPFVMVYGLTALVGVGLGHFIENNRSKKKPGGRLR